MAIQSSFYNVDGATRTYPSSKHIATKQNVSIWFKQRVDNVWVHIDPTLYSLVENSIIFITAPDISLYSELEVRVADTYEELEESPSAITLVSGALGDITSVVSNLPIIKTVADNISTLTELSNSLISDYSPSPAFKKYGGQLDKLANELSNPLCQYLGIVFIGDSITWGRNLPDNAVYDPRDGTLSDPRDIYASGSFVNNFKRFIGSEYFENVSPTLSNFPASTSGEAIAEFNKSYVLYPNGDPFFSYRAVGTSLSLTEVKSTAVASTGYQLQLADGNGSGTSYHEISFTFTGTTFDFLYGCVSSNACDYELFVDGVSQGIFKTDASNGGVELTNDNVRTHTFNYIHNKVITIRSNRVAYPTSTRVLRITAIRINKKVRITNQGINGSSTNKYYLYNLLGNYGDGVAVQSNDQFVFVMLGTNDRVITDTTPHGISGFKRNLKPLLDNLTSISDIILMCSLPAVNESSLTYSFTMGQCRDTLLLEAKSRSLDFIDNYSIFNNLDLTGVTTDGLHPNLIGHAIISRNIITSMRGV
jgi:lysophospholipase L1-like esterase